MSDDDVISITIKGIDKKAKENFALFCTMSGKSMNEVLKDFINGAYAPDNTQRQYMMIQTVNNLLLNNPKLIDTFILQQEPMYGCLDDFQKKSARFTFVGMNPSYIFEKYNNWLQEKD